MPRSTPRPKFVDTMTDEQWKGATLKERAVHVARSQDAVREFPKGSNWGPMVELYLKAAGVFSPAYWCAAFTTWCLLTAGADRKKLPKLAASTYYWWDWAKKNGRLEEDPRRGFLGVQNDKEGGHIWFCLDEADPHKSIEGNTNVAGARNGIGVFDRTRSKASMRSHVRHGFIAIDDSLF